MQPPVAPRRPHTHTEHDVPREDPWHWLRDREDPETLAYIEAENTFTEAALAPLTDLRQTLYDEMLSRIQETDRSSAFPRGEWAYYTRTEEGRAYTIHCREPRAGGPEQILLDENVLAEGHDFFSVGHLTVSPDHTRIAYTVDTSGNEIHTLFVVDLASGEIVDEVDGVSAHVVWGNDSNTVYWSEIDPTQRPWRVRTRTLPAGPAADDPILFEDPDGRFYVWIERTRPGRFLIVNSVHSECTERWMLDGDAPEEGLRCVQPRTDGLVYDVEVAHDHLLVRSNDGDAPARRTPEYRLYRAPLDSTSRADWVLELDAREGISLQGAHAFRTFRVLEERENGLVRLVVEQNGRQHVVQMQEASYVASFAGSAEYDGRYFHYGYSSMVVPSSTFRFDVDTAASTLLKQVPVPGYDPSAYHSTQVLAPAADGTLVPVSLVWKGDAELPAARPCMLYGYGSYGITVEPRFRSNWVSLADRGVVVAIAHIRGGGYLGRRWYEAAKFLTKATTFDDFIACARHLVDEGVTTPDALGIMGGSAGGMLMGAVMNRAPELFRAVIAAVPFVDCVTTMLDASLPLTVGEWEEWGNPQERTVFDAMMTYSPYDNVQAREYPDLLVTSGLNDPRVQYWEPTKWVARLRDVATGGQVLLKTHMGAGHQGKSGRYGHLEDASEELAWLLSKIQG